MWHNVVEVKVDDVHHAAKALTTAIQQRKDEADAEVVLRDTILWFMRKLMGCIMLPKQTTAIQQRKDEVDTEVVL